jgi:hypothetical protein
MGRGFRFLVGQNTKPPSVGMTDYKTRTNQNRNLGKAKNPNHPNRKSKSLPVYGTWFSISRRAKNKTPSVGMTDYKTRTNQNRNLGKAKNPNHPNQKSKPLPGYGTWFSILQGNKKAPSE